MTTEPQEPRSTGKVRHETDCDYFRGLDCSCGAWAARWQAKRPAASVAQEPPYEPMLPEKFVIHRNSEGVPVAAEFVREAPANGGPVFGPGAGTSDAIPFHVETGSASPAQCSRCAGEGWIEGDGVPAMACDCLHAAIREVRSVAAEPKPLTYAGDGEALVKQFEQWAATPAQEPADPPRPRAAIRTPMTADELAEIQDYRDKLAQNGILNASAYRLTALLNEVDRLRNQS